MSRGVRMRRMVVVCSLSHARSESRAAWVVGGAAEGSGGGGGGGGGGRSSIEMAGWASGYRSSRGSLSQAARSRVVDGASEQWLGGLL
jgi:hypothetical protein